MSNNIIKPKFGLRERVIFIANNKACQGTITDLESRQRDAIFYDIVSRTHKKYSGINESFVFCSTKEAIACVKEQTEEAIEEMTKERMHECEELVSEIEGLEDGWL